MGQDTRSVDYVAHNWYKERVETVKKSHFRGHMEAQVGSLKGGLLSENLTLGQEREFGDVGENTAGRANSSSVALCLEFPVL